MYVEMLFNVSHTCCSELSREITYVSGDYTIISTLIIYVLRNIVDVRGNGDTRHAPVCVVAVLSYRITKRKCTDDGTA